MKPEMSMNCKNCGKTFWSGTIDEYETVIDIMNKRNGCYCEMCADTT